MQQVGEILVHQKQYVANIEPLELETGDTTRKLTQEEQREYRALVGQLNWMNTQMRPDQGNVIMYAWRWAGKTSRNF